MKVFLLHKDRDFAVKPGLRDAIFGAMTSGDLFALANVRRDLQRGRNPGPVAATPGNDGVLTQDLELQTLWNAMAAGDEFLFEVAKRAILSSLTDPERGRVPSAGARGLPRASRDRQATLRARDRCPREREAGPFPLASGVARQHRLPVGTGADAAGRILKRLRQVAEQQAGNFRSEGFRRFFAMLREELSDGF